MRLFERIRRLDAHLERSDRLLTEIKEQFALNRREFELNRREFELNRHQSANNREVMRALIADINAQREESRRHNDAVVGALTDLAAEIRSWGGGTAPAS